MVNVTKLTIKSQVFNQRKIFQFLSLNICSSQCLYVKQTEESKCRNTSVPRPRYKFLPFICFPSQGRKTNAFKLRLMCVFLLYIYNYLNGTNPFIHSFHEHWFWYPQIWENSGEMNQVSLTLDFIIILEKRIFICPKLGFLRPACAHNTVLLLSSSAIILWHDSFYVS